MELKVTRMKKTMICCLMIFLQALSCYVFADANEKIKLRKVTDKIYVVESQYYYPENSAFYIGEKSVTVISATWTPKTAEALAKKVRQITEKPISTVINTHHHFDRTGGNSYFQKIGAKIISSKKLMI